ncbi:hypothetical protein BGZ51_007781 [Haplosporangium sp. Z 767]|nr:hypothetical protein BGZ51_007781 [Haplosporangium sp. Z 767]
MDQEQNRDMNDKDDTLETQCRQLMEASLDQSSSSSLPPEPWLVEATSNAPENSTWRLWYRTPAESIEWDGFLIGNGRTHVLVGGAINVERLILNEESCWSGGPGEFKQKSEQLNRDAVENDDADGFEYHGGNVPVDQASRQQEALQEFQRALKEKQVIRPSLPMVKTLQGDERGFGRPEAFGEIVVEEMRPFDKVQQYRRELDLETGVVKVSFSVGNVEYTREHFCSFPDSVCVMRLHSSEPKSINLKVSIRTAHDNYVEYSNVHNRLGLRSRLGSNNMTIETLVAVKTEGATGVTMSNNRQVIALGFNTVTLYYTMGTGWTAGSFPKFEEKDPHDRLVSAVDKVATGWYEDHYKKHVKDHQTLFQSFGLDFGQVKNKLPTNELVQAARKEGKVGPEENYLEALMVQYGRYLLIGSSRPGSLPISGQNAWRADADAAGNDEPRSGYKMNIDLQMNYWLAESTGLGETITPLIDFMETLLVPRGQDTALLHHGARGWTTYTYTNIWAHTGPTAQPKSFHFPAAAAWLCQHAWDRYLYSQDYYFLRDHAYKLMKGAAQFWLDTLVRHEDNNRSGNNETVLLTSPSYSPEHGPFTEGSALDQQLVWQLFNNTLDATVVVGERDKAFMQNLTSAIAELSPGLKIGNWGQLQEWHLDLDEPNEKHQHLGPFWAAYPGNQIFSWKLNAAALDGEGEDKDLLDAARMTLAKRGMGTTEDDIGWSKSWRAAVWARLGDGAKALEALKTYKTHNLKQSNLLNVEEGISGQLGIGAAIVEMVIQSRALESVDILTCAETGLPGRWLKKGSVQGFRTREGHNVTATWEDAKVRSVEVLAALKGGMLRIRIGTMKGEDETPSTKVHVTIKGSNKAPVYSREEDMIVLTVVKGTTYVIQIDP